MARTSSLQQQLEGKKGSLMWSIEPGTPKIIQDLTLEDEWCGVNTKYMNVNIVWDQY